MLITILYQNFTGIKKDVEFESKIDFDKEKALEFILKRRSIFPKDYVVGEKVSDDELKVILEAANWAPTHQKNEPWRFSILTSSDGIEKYFDFLQEWYDEHADNSRPCLGS